MSPSATALLVILIIVTVATLLGVRAGARRRMDLEQWTVGGRGFGMVLMYLLMAGEVYTTFSFLGTSGWAYSKGGPTLYILGQITWLMWFRFTSCRRSGKRDANTACKQRPISSDAATGTNISLRSSA